MFSGTIGNHSLGPYKLPPNSNEDSYLDFLKNGLRDLLDNLTLNLRQNMHFMQDGAPAHFSRQVRNYLNEIFPQRWIGRGSDFPWPARSPDLNPLDFCVWGYLKSSVYSEAIDTRDQLLQKIENSANLFMNESIFFKIRQSFMKHVSKCIEVNGDHFEHVLKKGYNFYFQ